MKLNEIIDTTFRERETNFGDSRTSFYAKKNNKILGRGAYGIVRDKKTDPFMVKKNSKSIAQNLLESDGYYAYIKYISDNKIFQHNPYAPRIYDIVLFKNTMGSEKYKADIEKLELSETLTNEEVEAISEQMFNKPLTGEQATYFSLAARMEQCINDRKKLCFVKDSNFKEIAEIIKNIIDKEPYFESDLHYNNFMVRRGPYGAQIVITDPIA